MGSLRGNLLHLTFTLALVLGSKPLMYGRRSGLCQGGCPMRFVSLFSQQLCTALWHGAGSQPFLWDCITL